MKTVWKWVIGIVVVLVVMARWWEAHFSCALIL